MSYTSTYKFADTVVRVSYETDYIAKQCKSYLSDEAPELELSVTENDVTYERERADHDGYPYGYLESLAFYRKFCSYIVNKNILLFHSSVIARNIQKPPLCFGKSEQFSCAAVREI